MTKGESAEVGDRPMGPYCGQTLARVILHQFLLLSCRHWFLNQSLFVYEFRGWHFGKTLLIGINHFPEPPEVHSDPTIRHICHTNRHEAILVRSALIKSSLYFHPGQPAFKD